jgi:photosystem II stability/assembly factor-like uncharacterized protein
MRLLLSVIIVFIVSFNSFAAGLRSVHTKDGINIWAAGSNGYIIQSSDAGNTWHERTFAGTNLNSIFAIQNNVLITGDGGVLFRSSDNGGTFNTQSIPGGANLNSIFMIDANTGWAAGNTGTLIKTVNGGLNWSSQQSNTADNLYSVKFTDIQTGVCCGANGRLLRTTNGGQNWNTTSMPAANDLLTIDLKGSVIFSFGTGGLGVRSTDSGNSWVLVDYNILTRQDINTVCMLSQSEYYSCGGGGFIRRTTDAGSTYEFQVNPILSGLCSIFFYNNNIGFAAGPDNNVVLKTTNAGVNWSAPNSMTQSLTWELKLIGSGVAQGNTFGYNSKNKKTLFCGSGNKIYRSSDVGETWSEFSTLPVGNIVNGVLVSQKDTNLFLVSSCTTVGTSDNLLRSTNNGISWVSVFNADFENDSRPVNMDPNHPDTVYLCIKNSLIYRSTNFGLNWTSTGPTVLGSVCILKVLDGNSNSIFCGVQSAPSKIYRSTDYAQSWSIADTVDAIEVPHIEGSNLAPGILYASAFFYGLLKSTDNGFTWNTIVLDDDLWGMDVAKDDPNVIVHGGSWGGQKPAYISVNGGTNFTATQPVPSGGNYAFFSYNRSTLLGQYSSRILKLKISYNIPIGINPISTEIPGKFSLHQNYPNPFNPETKIRFDLSKSGIVSIKIYDAIGREVAALVNEKLSAGEYSVDWDGFNHPSGVYFCRLESDNLAKTIKMVMIK